MSVLSCLLCMRARLGLRLRFFRSSVHKRITWMTFERSHTSDTPYSSFADFSNGLERYKDMNNYFNRKLKATYIRFSDIPDYSMVFGHHHVYFIEGDCIYRMDKRHRDMAPEQVLNLGQEEEEVGLDNAVLNHRIQWTVQRIRLSPREKHLAATVKTNQIGEPRCVIVRLGKTDFPVLEPSKLLFILDKVFTFEWATDEVLFYTSLEGLRCSRVFRLELTSSGSNINPVYEEKHPDVFVEVALSRDQQILSINCNSRTSSEVLVVDLATSHLEPFLVQPRQLELLYHVEHWRQRLIILASTGPGQEYQVVQALLSEPSMLSWVPLFTPDPGTIIKDMDVVGNHCVLVARIPTGEFVLIVVPLAHPNEVYTVQLPSWACAVTTKKPDIADQHSIFEFLISSPVHLPVPHCLYLEVGMLSSDSEDRSSLENQSNITTTRLEACSKDGTSVPLTVFHTAPMEGLREVPLLVHVYGAYGQDLNMEFCPEKRLLLEQGWALAYCHIRGGGERGLSWQKQARVGGKKRALEDLQACLCHLFSLGISSPSLTALTAFSAGAVPVGALCNTHPHMMRAVTLQAPFLDVLGTMEDPSLPLTLEDREEWGDPTDNPEHRLTISSYCPLNNVTPQRYPSILLTAYSGDARIPLAGVLKYAKRIKDAIQTHCSMKPKSECEPAPNIVLNIQSGINHFGPEDFEQLLEEEALKLAFLYAELGLDPPRPPRRRKQ